MDTSIEKLLVPCSATETPFSSMDYLHYSLSGKKPSLCCQKVAGTESRKTFFSKPTNLVILSPPLTLGGYSALLL